MNDSWYYTADLAQLRGELSWVFPWRHEVGFWFASGTTNADVTSEIITVPGQTATLNESLVVTDLYAFFYRHRMNECDGDEIRLFAGFTGQSDGLIGADGRFGPLAKVLGRRRIHLLDSANAGWLERTHRRILECGGESGLVPLVPSTGYGQLLPAVVASRRQRELPGGPELDGRRRQPIG